MKTLTTLFVILLSFTSISQDTIKEIDTTKLKTVQPQKTIILNPLPVKFYNVLKTGGDGVEVTMYKSSKTFTLPKNQGMNYFLSFLTGNAPSKLNPTNSAYAMFMVKEDFYLDAEISISKDIIYIIFKKDGKKYYNILNQKGKDFFKKMM